MTDIPSPTDVVSSIRDLFLHSQDMAAVDQPQFQPNVPPAPVGAAAGVNVAVDVPTQVGRGPIPPDGRKFKYDRVEGSRIPIMPSASVEGVMHAVEAGEQLHRIHKQYGIETAGHDFLTAFDNGLFLQGALNGTSILQPGRAFITVNGNEFDVAEYHKMLNENLRRFHRAFASETRDYLQWFMSRYDPNDLTQSELAGTIRRMSEENGIREYPHLCFDFADACTDLVATERRAVMAAKKFRLANTTNHADRDVVVSRVPATNRTNV